MKNITVSRPENEHRSGARKRTRLIRRTILVVVAWTVVSIGATAIPLRHALMARVEGEIDRETQLISEVVSQHFAGLTMTAKLVSAQTDLREELVAVNGGQRPVAAFQAAAEPRFADVVAAVDPVVGIARITPGGTIVAAAGSAPSVPLSRVRESENVHIVTPPQADTTDPPTFVVVAPIGTRDAVGQDRIVGYDLVTVSVVQLASILDRLTSERPEIAFTLKDTRGTTVLGDPTAPPPADADRVLHVRRIVPPGWELTVSHPRAVATRHIDVAVGWIGGVLIVTAIAAFLVLRTLLGRFAYRAAELQRIVDEQRIMHREVHHRIKNDLATVGSLLMLRRQHSKNAEIRSALSEAEGRVHMIVGIYDELYRSDDVGRVDIAPVLTKLLSAVVHTHGDIITSATPGREPELELAIEEVDLDRKLAVPVSVIANELVVNAMKYGHPPNERGRITVRLNRDLNEALTLQVKDNGPGLPSNLFAGGRGFGGTMITALAEQFGGNVEVDNTPSGGRVTVTIPAQEKVPGRAEGSAAS